MHTLLDVQSAIPVLIDITDAQRDDSHVLDRIVPEPGCFIVMDRGYIDFPRLYRLHQALAYFVIRAKQNFQFRRRQSHPVDRSTGVRTDQTIVLTGKYTVQKFPAPASSRQLLRRRHRSTIRLSHEQLSDSFARSSLPSIINDGRSNCFSNGSSSTCASNASLEPLPTRSKLKSGLRWPLTPSSPS